MRTQLCEDDDDDDEAQEAEGAWMLYLPENSLFQQEDTFLETKKVVCADLKWQLNLFGRLLNFTCNADTYLMQPQGCEVPEIGT